MDQINIAREIYTPRLRLDTLIRLRWLAILGQTIAVFTVHFGFGFPLQLVGTLFIISVSVCLNMALRYYYPQNHRVEETSATLLLAYDVLQLAALLYLTGGLENPFSSLFLAPVLISATALPPKRTQMLGLLAVACVTCLGLWHQPLPWVASQTPNLPRVYVLGVWFSILLGLAFIGVYAWRVSDESRQLSDALAATEFVLAREQHLSAVDGLAAAAAHQLGTPLATIALVVNELDRSIQTGHAFKEDIVQLKEQAGRCREILAKIASLGDETTGPLDTLSFDHLLEEVVAPHRSFGISISVICNGMGDAPLCTRNPGILYGLGNLVDNAIDFAQSSIAIIACWSEREVKMTIRDDGPGFAWDVLSRLGEPYVTTRNMKDNEPKDREHGGLGLGLFIAKTLLERSGATVDAKNALPPDHGAVITIIWPRRDFEAGLKIYGQGSY